jgi:alpha-tubulin suppressor-like RCC1 family protein
MPGKRFPLLLIAVVLLGGSHFLWKQRDTLVERLPDSLRARLESPAVVPAPGVIGMGHWHIVALRADGEIYGWGDNRKKELGLPRVSSLPVPKPIAADRAWRYLTSGNKAAYAITADGELWRRAFRRNTGRYSEGELEQRIDYQPLFPQRRWQKVLESQGWAVGLDVEGRLWSWDEGLLEQRTLLIEGPLQIQLALAEDGTLPPAGEADADRIAADERASREAWLSQMKTDWTRAHMPNQPDFLDTPAGRPVLEKMQAAVDKAVAESRQQMEAHRQAKSAAAGQILFPAPVTPDRGWVDFCVDRVIDGINGPGRIYAVDRDGGLWKSGDPIPMAPVRDIRRFEMTQLTVAAKLTRVFCRENAGSVFALDERGRLWGFGTNASGRLGNGDGRVYGKNEPVPESGMKQLNDKRWIEIAPGITATYGITRDGALWGWGANHGGALGTGDDDSHHDVPTLIDKTHTWVAVAAGYESGAALTSTGQLYTWGQNGAGLLGEGGSTKLRNKPGLTEVADGWWQPQTPATP